MTLGQNQNQKERMLPIGQEDIGDPFYRYQMPSLEIRIQGKSKHTVLENLVDVSEALDRPTDEIIGVLARKLGTRGTLDSIRGEFTRGQLQEYLQEYIETYVLCSVCGNPETRYSVSKKRMALALKCKACGSRSGITDQNEHIYSFVLKRCLRS